MLALPLTRNLALVILPASWHLKRTASGEKVLSPLTLWKQTGLIYPKPGLILGPTQLLSIHPGQNRNGPKCQFSKKPVRSSRGKLPAGHGHSQQEPPDPTTAPEAADREARTQLLVEMRPHHLRC